MIDILLSAILVVGLAFLWQYSVDVNSRCNEHLQPGNHPPLLINGAGHFYTKRKRKMENVKNLTPGECVWVIIRDEIGEPAEINGYMYLAHVEDAVILTPYINSLTKVEDVIEHLIKETAEDDWLPLVVFPDKDCYLSYEEAQAALEQETGAREEDNQ